MANAYDYIIIGGGTAGCVLASRLSLGLPADRSKVLLVEYGPNALNHEKVTNPQRYTELLGEGLAVVHPTTPQAGLNGRTLPTVVGRMLSGSSGANVGNWCRGSEADYRSWAKLAGHSRFEYKNLLPYFKRTETWTGPRQEQNHHGHDGPVHIITGRSYPLREPIAKGFEEMGIMVNPDNFSGAITGVSPYAENFRLNGLTGIRQHSGFVYDLSRVEVRTNTRVDRVLLDEAGTDPRAIGVQLADGSSLYANQEVVLCAGAIKSPQLLMLSGIGPKTELEQHGIQVRVDSAEVGRNHWDHLALAQPFKLKDPSKNQSLLAPGFWKDEYAGGSPIDWVCWVNVPVDNAFEQAISKDKADLERTISASPDRPQLWFSNLYIPMPVLNAERYSHMLPDGSSFNALAALMLPTSRGSLSLKSSDPSDDPVLDPAFLTTGVDQHLAIQLVRTMYRTMETDNMSAEVSGEVTPDGQVPLSSRSSDEEILARIKDFAGTVWHPAGTTALGKVVDADFKVRGAKCLRVVDAGTFPEPMAGFPQSTVYAWGELGADLIIQEATGSV